MRNDHTGRPMAKEQILEELIMLLERHGDLVEFFKAKAPAAQIDENPYLNKLNPA